MAKFLDLRYSDAWSFDSLHVGWDNTIYNLINYLIAELPVGWTYSDVNNPVPTGSPVNRSIKVVYSGINTSLSFVWYSNNYIWNGNYINFATVDVYGNSVIDFNILRFETTEGIVLSFAPTKLKINSQSHANGVSSFSIKLVPDSNSYVGPVRVINNELVNNSGVVLFSAHTRVISVGRNKDGVPSSCDVFLLSSSGFYCGKLKDSIYTSYAPGLEFTDGTNMYVITGPDTGTTSAQVCFKYG